MKDYKAAQAALKLAKEKKDEAATKTAQDELNALILFKSDMGAFIRLYTFLSQIFDYGNTALEKRAIFYKRLLPLLEFGREREGIDLSKVVPHASQPEKQRPAASCRCMPARRPCWSRSPKPVAARCTKRKKPIWPKSSRR